MILLQCSVLEGELHCQCILSVFPASEHQFYANILLFVNINPFLYISDQFALIISASTYFRCTQLSFSKFSPSIAKPKLSLALHSFCLYTIFHWNFKPPMRSNWVSGLKYVRLKYVQQNFYAQLSRVKKYETEICKVELSIRSTNQVKRWWGWQEVF